MGKVRIIAGIGGAVVGLLAAVTLAGAPVVDRAAATATPERSVGVPVQAAQSAVVNMAALAKQDAARPAPRGQSVVRVVPAPRRPPKPGAGASPLPLQFLTPAGLSPQVPSPDPAQDFAGLDDITDISSPYHYRVIPPDTDGAVGLTKVMSGLNNNYRIWTKSTGAEVSTVGTEAFWTAVGGADLFDPRTLYDPINDRWIVVMMSGFFESFINIGVSQTSDPSGSYTLFSVNADPSTLTWADFPTIGFNKDYIAVNVNMYDNTRGSYLSSKALVVDYPALRAGTLTSWFVDGSEYCSAPAATYSATESRLYVATQEYGAPGTYHVDTITKGAGGAPVYTVGAMKSRGLSWGVPDFNILPQKPTAAAPRPMGIEAQDDMIRSTPVTRGGFIYYTQSVGLPARAMTRSSVLWTKLEASTGEVADGGLIDDPTATATNGGEWYSYPHIAVNKYGDIIVGFSQFSSAQWASAGYAVHAANDPAGTMREPVVYKAGEDLYQKDYGSGRNRWGDYSKAQVDPSNDADLWVLNEYSKPITGPSDWGGVWGTWWAKVAAPTTPPTITSLTPTSGPVGTSVILTGSDFSGATAVTFGGAAASFSVDSAAQITATVPAGATTGRVTVTTAGGTAASPRQFTVTAPAPAPAVVFFSPAAGPVGTSVTIIGAGFIGATAVRFNGTAASFSVDSAVQITAAVPAGALSGPISVTTWGGTAASAASFTVTLAPTATLKMSGLTSGF